MHLESMMELHRPIAVALLFRNLCCFSINDGPKTDAKRLSEIQDSEGETLNVLREQVIANSFKDYAERVGFTYTSYYQHIRLIEFRSSNQTTYIPAHFEASNVILRADGQMMYVVFDNTFEIGAFCGSATGARICVNRMSNWLDESVRDLSSNFEGIAYNSLADTYLIAQEAIPTVNDVYSFKPDLFEVRFGQQRI